MKKFLTVLIALSLILTATSCGTKTTSGDNNSTTNTTATTKINYTASLTNSEVGFQLESPQKGEEIAVLTIKNYGEIKIRLFPDSAPKAVENFKTHIKNGYYNGLIFHRVINDFMIQGGDPTGTGTGGESIWGSPFEDEFNSNLRNFRGALSMANSGSNTNGSQFFIVQAKTVAADLLAQMEQITDGRFDEKINNLYKQNGGTPWLDFAHTVFGQVFEGMDIVDKIAATDVDGNDKPTANVVIEKAEIVKY